MTCSSTKSRLNATEKAVCCVCAHEWRGKGATGVCTFANISIYAILTRHKRHPDQGIKVPTGMSIERRTGLQTVASGGHDG